jgi:hypothetical protein
MLKAYELRPIRHSGPKHLSKTVLAAIINDEDFIAAV